MGIENCLYFVKLVENHKARRQSSEIVAAPSAETCENVSTPQPVEVKESATEAPIINRFPKNVTCFRAAQLSIKVVGNALLVEGVHETEKGILASPFVHRYTVPSGYDIQEVIAKIEKSSPVRAVDVSTAPVAAEAQPTELSSELKATAETATCCQMPSEEPEQGEVS